jgi:outer membrane protein assembly factor BamD
MYHGGTMILVFSRRASQALLLSLLLLISGCSWFGGDDDELIADSGEQQMYREAQRHLKNENFSLAVRSLTGARKPLPVWSIR